MSGRAKALLPLALLLAGCGGRPGDAEVERSLERAWDGDTVTMEVAAGMMKAEDAATMQGARTGARAALGAVRAYAGDTVAGLAADAVGGFGEFATGVSGLSGTAGARQAALLTAHDWDVGNLEVLDARAAEHGHVLRVRYDLAATMAGRRQSVARDLTQTIRLESRDGQWEVAPARM